MKQVIALLIVLILVLGYVIADKAYNAMDRAINTRVSLITAINNY